MVLFLCGKHKIDEMETEDRLTAASAQFQSFSNYRFPIVWIFVVVAHHFCLDQMAGDSLHLEEEDVDEPETFTCSQKTLLDAGRG
jgi:hypothetical protein